MLKNNLNSVVMSLETSSHIFKNRFYDRLRNNRTAEITGP